MMKIKSLILHCFILLLISSCSSPEKSNSNTDFIQEIITSIENNQIDKVKKLINEKNVNSADSTGTTLLSYAVRTKDTSIVKFLLEKGADPNLQNKDDYLSTTLMECSNYNLVEIAKLLIDNGADINIQDKNGDPVINWTAYYGQVEFTKLLLDNNATTNLKSIHSDGVMQVALKEWHYDVVDLLLEYNVSEYAVDSNMIPLINAVKNNDIKSVKENLSKTNVNTRDGSSNSLLMIASENGYTEIVNELLAKSADKDAINTVGQTALSLAVFFGHTQIAELLIAKGADVNKTDEHFKITALEAAARENRISLGELLIKHGADINFTDGINNFTPVIWATLYRNADFVKMLLQYNPDLSIVSKYETTVFDMTSNDTILQMLNEAG